MSTLFAAVWALVPMMVSLLLAARLWGRERVLKCCDEMWWRFKKSCINLTRRTVAAVRVFLAEEVDEYAALDELEERVEHRLQGRLTALDAKIYKLQTAVELIERHMTAVIAEGDD
jgi:hypothetical protein